MVSAPLVTVLWLLKFGKKMAVSASRMAMMVTTASISIRVKPNRVRR